MTRTLGALVLCACLTLPAAAPARPPALIGVQDDPVFVRDPGDYRGLAAGRELAAATGYALARGLGAGVLRIAIHWSDVVTGSGRQSWARYDAAIAAARAHGFTVQLVLSGPAPAAATADHRVGIDRPNAAAFGRFAGAAARRYRGRVEAYSIWNEPNWPSLLAPHRDAAKVYRRLYQAGFAAIRRTDPRALVLLGELAPLGPPEAGIPPLRFLRQLTCAGTRHRCAPLVADGLALHPYTLRWKPSFPGGPDDATTGSLPRLDRTLRRLAAAGSLRTPGGRGLPVYLTEYGWRAGDQLIGEAARAAYAPAGYGLALSDPNVRELVWYQLASPPPNPFGIWDTGLVSFGGAPSATYIALQRWLAVYDASQTRGAPHSGV
jgi:hypothetical protein